MKATTIILMIITITSKVIGALRDAVLARLFGTGDVAAAFNLAMSIPVVIFSFISVGITTGFIPTYKRLEDREGYLIADRFTSNLGNIILVISLILMVICQIFAKQITYLFAFKLESGPRELTTIFTQITYFSLPAMAVATVYRGYLNCKNEFVVPAIQGFILNFFILISLFLGKYVNVYFLAIGLTFATIAQFVPYIPAIKKRKFKWTKILNIREPEIKSMLIMAIPVIFGTSISQLNIIIDKNLSSLILGTQGINVMNYSSKLSEFVNGIVIVSITTVAYPLLSKIASRGNIKEFKKTILDTLTSMNILVLPAMIGLAVLSEPIVRLVYEGGIFKPEDTVLTAPCLLFYALGLLAIGARDVLFKSFYSLKDTKTPTINSFYMVLVNIVTSIILSRFIGLTGLALGSTIAAYYGAITLYLRLRKKIGEFSDLKIFKEENIKMIIASLLMGAFAYISFSLLNNIFGSNVSLLISIMMSALVYLILLLLFRVKELYALLNSIKNKLSRKK